MATNHYHHQAYLIQLCALLVWIFADCSGYTQHAHAFRRRSSSSRFHGRPDEWLARPVASRTSSSALGATFDTATTTPLLEKAGGVLYRTSVFTKDEYSAIAEDVATFSGKLQQETSSSVAQFRMGTQLPPDSASYLIFQNGGLSRLVEQVAGPGYELSTRIPVEVRVYAKPGACMSWHSDDVLYDPPQLEVVWTLDNNSDCVTMWKQLDESVRSVETDRNSVIILKAGGPEHCVKPLKHGKRTIVKCAFIHEGATYQEGMHKDQFGSTKKQKKGRRKKR